MSKETKTSVLNDKTLVPVSLATAVVVGVISIVSWGSSLSAQVQANADTNEQQDEVFAEYAEESKEDRKEILRHILDIKLDVQDLKSRSGVE